MVLQLYLRNRFYLDGYLLIRSIGLFFTTILIRIAYQIYRNQRGLAIAEKTKKLEGVVILSFSPTRPQKIRVGQYLYLRIPTIRPFSFAESYPINILQQEESNTDRKTNHITVLTKVETGFTRQLDSYQYNSLRIILDGLYGKPKDTDYYNSFVFITTGIGISAQLAYLKELIIGRDQGQRLRRVCLIQQVDEEGMFQ